MEISQYKERIKKDIILPLKEQMKELGISCGYDFFAVWECEVFRTGSNRNAQLMPRLKCMR